MSRIAVILLAKSAVTAQPLAEMRRMAGLAEARRPDIAAFPAYSEQGSPSLREALLAARDGGFAELRIVPMLLPMEPAFPIWIRKVVARWQAEAPGDWPPIRLGTGPAECAAGLAALTEDLLDAAETGTLLAPPVARKVEGSLVPAQKYRVLVCAGGPCNDAGSATVWGHLRNEQERLGLRIAGAGMMSAKSTCLGPCSLAPVLQVWPDGTTYGGVSEAGVDRILAGHILEGTAVADLAYAPTGRKQVLRTAEQASGRERAAWPDRNDGE